MTDERYYDLIYQSRSWDREIGRRSYCVHAARIAAGLRAVPNLDVAKDRARGLLAGVSTDTYIEIVSRGRVYATVTV